VGAVGLQRIKAGSTLSVLKLTKNIMRNKKSVLMTSKVNYGYFSGVGGIAGNVWWLCLVAENTRPILN
jgi:hypothetical protein